MKSPTKYQLMEQVSKSFTGVKGDLPKGELQRLMDACVSQDHLDIELAPSAIFIFDNRVKKFVFIEEKAAEFLGMKPEDIIKLNAPEFISMIITDEHAAPIAYLGQKLYQSFYRREYIENASINLEFNYYGSNSRTETGRLAFVYKPGYWNEEGKPLLNIGKIINLTHISKLGPPRLCIIQNGKIIYNEEANGMLLSGKNEFGLTRKEMEIIRHTAEGIEIKAMALKLNTSIATIYTHRKNIKEKTKIPMPKLITVLQEKGLI